MADKMDDSDELKVSLDGTSASAPIEVRKNIPLKLQSGTKKTAKTSSNRKQKAGNKKSDKNCNNEKMDTFEKNNSDEDFAHVSTNKVAAGDPLHKNGLLQWDHKVNLLGEKMQDIDIHCCELCDRPILTYGRMLPCKHIFCWRCAKRNDTKCARCQHPVNRVEQCELGKVFVCVVDATKDGKDGCKRTYLSLRDLHAHMNYRHRGVVESNITNNSNPTPQPAIMNMVTTTHSVDTVCQRPSTSAAKPSRMSNLITVPLQDARQAPIPQNYNNYVPYNATSNTTPFTRPTFNPNVPPPNYSVTQPLPNFPPHIQAQTAAAAVFAAVGSRNWPPPGTQRPPRTGYF